MGNSTNPSDPLQKGEGFRVISVKENSPFHNKVDPFFDFVIDVIPQEPQRAPTDILDKLSGGPPQKKSPLQVLNENVNRVITVKVVSTKYRKVRSIEVTPSNEWSGSTDLTGATFRKERFDQAFETYFPITDIHGNSPIKKAGVKEGQYLVGCLEFAYPSLDSFTEALYEKYFDRENPDKTVHLAVYDIATDTLALRQVVLARGWGGKGLLGCEFLQGMLNKFPTNLEEQRKQILQKEAKKNEAIKLRSQMGDCDGASKVLAQSLQSQRARKLKQYEKLRSILNVQPPTLRFQAQPQEKEHKPNLNPVYHSQDDTRVEQLEKRVAFLQSSFAELKHCLTELKQLEEVQVQREHE